MSDVIWTESAGAPLRWNDGAAVHAVLATTEGGITVQWTACLLDVPEGAVVDDEAPVTCPACLVQT